ncbi:MAG TPA: antibiotic biosynthesis monooxygenase [Candidatus Aquilonibacter sp.]
MIDMRTKFVAVSMYTVTPDKLSAMADTTRGTMEREVRGLAGFCEGIVMTDEEQKQVLIVTQWESKDAWARAQWEPTIGRAVADAVEGATAYNVRTFVPITVVWPEAGSR